MPTPTPLRLPGWFNGVFATSIRIDETSIRIDLVQTPSGHMEKSGGDVKIVSRSKERAPSRIFRLGHCFLNLHFEEIRE